MICPFSNEVAGEKGEQGNMVFLLLNLTDEMFSLLFAVDVVLVSHTVKGLQNPLNVLARTSAKIGLKVNLDKTKVNGFQKRRAPCSA